MDDLNREAKLTPTDPEEMLKMVLRREAATAARYDARIAELERERDAFSHTLGEWQETAHFQIARAEAAEARADRLAAQLKEAVEAMSDIVEGWDWWQKDPYDRDQSVPGDAVEAARATLARMREDTDGRAALQGETPAAQEHRE